MAYKPKPIDTSASKLPSQILDLLELLAKNNHEVWAQRRIEEGWTHGPRLDDRAKKHPNLVPYDELTESEKGYDRRAAVETLKAIIAMGYRIEKAA